MLVIQRLFQKMYSILQICCYHSFQISLKYMNLCSQSGKNVALNLKCNSIYSVCMALPLELMVECYTL